MGTGLGRMERRKVEGLGAVRGKGVRVGGRVFRYTVTGYVEKKLRPGQWHHGAMMATTVRRHLVPSHLCMARIRTNFIPTACAPLGPLT